MLVVLYVFCMLIWPWPDPRSRSCGNDHQPPSVAFIYRPDALPDVKPTVSYYWWQLLASGQWD